MSDLRIEECLNETCPWSGKPVSADSLTRYRGRVVGFCNPGCRDRFDIATRLFDAKRNAAERPVPGGTSTGYRRREFASLGRWSIGDHRLKIYGISLPGAAGRVRELLESARGYTEQVLPAAAVEEGDPSGLGYVILHSGEAGTWLLVHWWAHHDIACQRLALHSHDAPGFRSMDDRPLHACVWEQVVIHHESNVWVRRMMTATPDAAAYLRDVLDDGLY